MPSKTSSVGRMCTGRARRRNAERTWPEYMKASTDPVAAAEPLIDSDVGQQ